jgi:hypothetical protein
MNVALKRLVDKSFWVGVILGTSFCVGFFLYPWVAYGAVSLIDFESFTVGVLNGQGGWTSTDGAVVLSGGNKSIELDGADTAAKAFNIVTTEVLAFDILPASDLDEATSRYNYLRFCNGGDCSGSGEAGFVISIEGAGGDYFNVYNLHSTGDPDALAFNVPNTSTTTLYFLFFNGHIGFSTACETYGCSMTTYDPYYVTDSIDDIDNFRIESYNAAGYDMYYDNFRTIFYYEVSVDPSDSDYTNVSEWSYGDGFAWKLTTCDIGYDCAIEINWQDVNDGNVAYLMDEDRTTEYDVISLDGDTGRIDWFDVPASTTPGYATFDILIENLNGYYTDELSTVGWKAFEDVWVKWEGEVDTDGFDLKYDGVCADVCADLATTSELTFWETFKDQMTCGGRMFSCWAFTPGDTGKRAFKDMMTTAEHMWPFSMITTATELIYTEGPDGVQVVANENASTTMTLDGGVMFSAASATVPVLSTDMFDDWPIVTLIKEKISILLYALLFFFIFVRVMGSAWLPSFSSSPYTYSDPVTSKSSKKTESEQVWKGNFLTGYTRKTRTRSYVNSPYGKVYFKKK